METLRVADLMSSSVITVRADDNLSQAYDLMTEEKIRHLPVVNEDNELEGLVTHTDLVRSALYALEEIPMSEERHFLETTKVREAMTHDPQTIEAEANLEEAAKMLLDNKYGCLPVTDGREVIGIITESDFIKHVLREIREGELDESGLPVTG